MGQDDGRPGGLSSLRDGAVPSPPKASIPDAGERKWTLWSDERCPNERGAYRFRASFDLLGLPVTAEWTEELHLCGMGYGESEWWPLRSCYWNGYRRYITNNTLEWSPTQDGDEGGVRWQGLDLMACPFTGECPKVEAVGQFIGAPLWRSEAIYLWSSAVPRRRWTNAAKMVEAWNTRAPAIADQSPEGGDACGSIHASGGGKANRPETQGTQP